MRSHILVKWPVVTVLICCLAAALPTSVVAQQRAEEKAIDIVNTNYHKVEDVVYLNNGWIIRGRIQYYKPGEKVRIVTVEGNEFVFYGDEIAKVTQEPKRRKRERPAMEQGSYVGISLAWGTGRDPWGGSANASGVQWTVGKMFTPRIGAGAGVGLDWYNGQRLLPITAEGRYLLAKENRSQPYIRGFGGYSLGWLSYNQWLKSYGGPTGGLDIGIATRFFEYAALNLALGIAYQRDKITYEDWNWGGSVTEINHYSRLWLRVGLMF